MRRSPVYDHRSSILTDVEAVSRSVNFWRCFTHWIGGMGVLVFLLAVIPLSGGSHINLMRAESPGPSVGKLVPKIKYTARILYIIYIGLTLVQINSASDRAYAALRRADHHLRNGGEREVLLSRATASQGILRISNGSSPYL